MSYGLLLLRVVIGAALFGHGAQKLFGWFGGHGAKATGGFFGQLGYRAPLLMAVLAGASEASGALLALGFVTPLACVAIAVVMINAIGIVHWKNGFWNTNGGIEVPADPADGRGGDRRHSPGRFSIDRAIGWDDNISGVWWGVGVLVVALATSAAIQVFGRRRQAAREARAAA